MRVYIGADYRGQALEQGLLQFLAGYSAEVVKIDVPVDDYKDAAVAVARAVREDDPSARGILICDSAHGMTMQANRFKGIRAANCDTAESAQLAREHDDANVICLSAHFTSAAELPEIVQAFLQTDFIPIERRVRRINRLDERSD